MSCMAARTCSRRTPPAGSAIRRGVRCRNTRPTRRAGLGARRNVGTGFAADLYARVVSKLEREPVEDFRLDFEDGYGNRPDAQEDEHAVASRGRGRGRD